MNLIKKIQENIFRYELFERESKIVVGVSGGPDSVCLLDALYKLKKNIISNHHRACELWPARKRF